MAIRKSVTNLTSSEKSQFITGVKALKNMPPLTIPGLTLAATNRYDSFVEIHDRSMDTLTPDPIESGDPRSRNAAHQGPAFFEEPGVRAGINAPVFRTAVEKRGAEGNDIANQPAFDQFPGFHMRLSQALVMTQH